MRKSKFTAAQVAYALRQVESGTPPAHVCRQLGVSEEEVRHRYAALGVLQNPTIWISLNLDLRMTAPNAEQSTFGC